MSEDVIDPDGNRIRFEWKQAVPKAPLLVVVVSLFTIWLGPSVTFISLLLLPALILRLGGYREDYQKAQARHPAVYGFLGFVIGMLGILQLTLISQASPKGGLAILLLAAAWAAIRMPFLLCGGMVFLAASNGGQWVLFAAPVIVLLAARSIEVTTSRRLSRRGWLRSTGVAVVAFFLSFLVSNLGIGGGGGSGGDAESLAEATRERGSAKPSDSSFIEWLNRLLGREAEPVGTDRGDGVGSYQPPESETNWWVLLAAATLVAAFVGLAYYLWKRRAGSGPTGEITTQQSGAWSMARLERIGETVGRPRQGHEGAITYADALAKHTGDARLSAVGPLISAQVFHGVTDQVAVESTIDQIEANPPQGPPAPPEPTRRARAVERAGVAMARVRQNPKKVGYAFLAVSVVGVAALYVGTHTSDLALAYTDSESGASQRTEPPRELNAVLGVLLQEPDAFHRWEICSSIETNLQDNDVAGIEYSPVQSEVGFVATDSAEFVVTDSAEFVATDIVGSSRDHWNFEDGYSYRQWDLYSNGERFATTLTEDETELVWFDMPAAEPPATFPSLDDIVAAIPGDREVVERVDSHGNAYTRYVFDRPVEGDRLGELDGWFETREFSVGDSLLDIWVDDGEIVRTRMQEFVGTTAYWQEYRVLETVPTTLDEAFGETCPRSGFAPTGDWVGIDANDIPTAEVLDGAPAAVDRLLDVLAKRPGDIQRWKRCSSWEFVDDAFLAAQDLSSDEGWVWGSGGFNVDGISGITNDSEPEWDEWNVGDMVFELAADDRYFSPEGSTTNGPFVWRDFTDVRGFSYADSEPPPSSVAVVLDILGEPRSVSERIDRFGEGFTRYVFDNDVDYDDFNDRSGGGFHAPGAGWPTTIDIWADGDSIQRLRSQPEEYEGEIGWIEFVILDREPETFADLFVDAECPSSALAPTGDWRGVSLSRDS